MVLAIGFSVDYSVHIAHAYAVATGDSSERTATALTGKVAR